MQNEYVECRMWLHVDYVEWICRMLNVECGYMQTVECVE